MAKRLLRYFLFIFIFFIAGKVHGGVSPLLHYTFANLLAPGDTIITSTGGKTLCPGGSMTLTAGTATASTFVWYRDGQPISGGTTSSITIKDIGRYQVYVTTAPATSPVQYPFIDITIATVPVAGFTHSADGQCSNASIQFNNTSTGVISSYTWDFGDGGTSNLPNPTHTFNATAGCGSSSFQVKLTVTNNNGCSNTTSGLINILNPPDVAIEDLDTYNQFSNCKNSPSVAKPNYTLKIKNTSPGASCISSYSIDWGDGNTQNNITATAFQLNHTYTQLGAFNLVVTATGTNGCNTSKTYRVANQTNPAGGLSTPGGTVGCAPMLVPFTITNWQSNSPGTTYILDFGDGSTQTFTHPLNSTSEDQVVNHNYTKSSCPAKSFIATLTVINACDNTPFTAGNIQVSVKAKANFTYSPNPVCDQQNVCFTNNTTPGAYGNTCIATTTYSWDFGEPSSGTNNNSTATSPCHKYAAPGTYTVTLTSTNGCGADVITHNVTINPLPTMTSPTTATICSGTAFSIPLTSDIPATYSWVATNNANISGESLSTQTSATLSNTLINNTSTVQVVTYTVTPISVAGCSGTPQIVKVTVNPAPAIPSVTSLVNYCQGDIASALNATATTGNTLYWYTSASGGLGSTTAPTPTTTSLGTVNYYVGQTSNGTQCESPRVQITVVVSAIPSAPAVSTSQVFYCQGSATSALSATASTGNNLRWYTQAVGGTPTTAAPIPSSVNPGSTNYYVSQVSTGGCESTRSSIAVVINPLPSAPSSVATVNYCQNATPSPLSATADIGNSLKWYTVSLGGTSSNTAIIPSTSTAGNKSYYVSQITPSGCESSRTAITVVVSAIPTKPTVVSQLIYCVNDISSPITATPATGSTLKWYTNAALTGGNTTAPTLLTTSTGSSTYYVTQFNSAGCESPAAAITVTVNPLIANNTIDADQTICAANAPNTLAPTATLSGGNNSYTYQWQSSVNRGTSWTDITGATSATYTPGVLNTSTQYHRIVNSGTCSNTSNAVTITVQGTLDHYGISSAQTICNGNQPALLSGELPTGGNSTFTYQWETSANGVNWQAINGATTKDYQPPALTATNYYRRRVFSNVCSSISPALTITVNPVAVVNPISDQYFCNGSNVAAITLGAVPASGTTFAWTNDNAAIGLAASGSGSLPAFTAANNTKAPLIAHITVTATYTANGTSCDGTPLSFSITVLPSITLSANPDAAVCAGSTIPAFSPVADAAAFTGSTVTYSWTASVAIGLTAGSGNQVPAFTAINNGTTDLSASIQVTPLYHYKGHTCNGLPLNYTITVNPKPTVANAGSDDKTCGVTYTLKGNAPAVGTGTWTASPGQTITFSNANLANAQVSGLQKGNRYQLTWTISNHTCTSSNASIYLDVLSDLLNTIKADVAVNCPGQAVNLSSAALSGGDIPAVLPASYTYTWESSANGVDGWQAITGGNAATLTVKPMVSTFYRRLVSSYNQCAVVSNIIAITINASAPTAIAGQPLTLCGQATAQLQGNNPGAGFTGTWTDAATGSSLTFSPDAHAYNAVLGGLVPGKTYHLVWSIASPSCGNTSSPLSINNLPLITNQISPLAATICLGQAVSITGDLPTGGTGSYTYNWESSTDQATWTVMAGQTAQNLNFSPSASVYIRRNVVSGSCNLESAPVHITVQQALANNSISGSQQVCTGKPVPALTGSLPTGGDGTYFYQWQQSANQTTWIDIASATQSDYQPGPLTQSTYFRRVVSTALCSGLQSNASAAVLITVNPNAHADFSASLQSGCVPFNLSTVITQVPHNDVNGLYQWYANGVLIGSGAAFPGYTINTDGQSVVIKLLATSKFGCDTNSRSITFSTVKNVTPAFIKSQAKGCGPLSVQFTNTSVPLTGATYLWDFGNGQTSAQAQPGTVTFQPHPLSRDTTYIITLKATTSCGLNIYTDSVTVRPAPRAIFTPDKTIGCSPFTVHITNQSRGIPNQYTFDFGNGDTQTLSDNQAIQYTYITAKTDTFTMKLYARNECGIDSSSYRIVVYPNTVQANLVVNGTNKTGCVPYTVSFDNNSTGANSFLYDYADGTTAATSVSPETQVHTFTKPGVYTVKLTASNGCSTASANQTITVLAQPVTGFQIGQLQYCVKDSAAFTNSTSALSSFSYVWDFGDGSNSNQIQPKHVYATPGKYTVKLTALQNSPGATCSATASHELTILPLPIASFNSNAANLNCAPFLLSVSSTPANAASVSWNFGDPNSTDNTATGYAAQHRFGKPGLYLVKQIAYNQTGCLDSATQVIRVTETPKASFATGDSVICGNSALLHFTNSSTYGGTDQVNYRWLVNNAFISNQQNLTYQFNAPAGTILPYALKVKLIAYSTVGCPDTTVHTILFNPLPVAGFTAATQASCAPFTLSINNTSAYADGYRWYLNNALVSTVKTPVNILLQQANQSYTLKQVTTNAYGCRADSVTQTFTTYPKPTAAFSLTDSVSCNGQLSISISNTTVGATSYTWNFGDGSAESTAAVPAHVYGVPGMYQLRLVAFNSTCRDTLSHTIKLAQPVKAAFTANVLKGCSQITTSFQNLAVNASSYQWDFGDGTFSTAKNPVHVFTYNGSPFTVKLTAYGEYGCSDETVQVNYITVSAPPVVNFSAQPDSVISIPNHTFNFKNLSTGGIQYHWDFGDGMASAGQNPSHTYADAGIFKVRLIVTNAQGCQSARTRTVQIAGVPQYLYVPNAFEPGSAKSELKSFNVRGTGMMEYRLRIFNKWGQLLFQTTALDGQGVPLQGWDGNMQGQPAPQGVYIWDIQARFLDGTLWHGMKYADDKTPSTTGTIHLMR